MIRAEPKAGGGRPAINPMRGEFDTLVAGRLCRFDTRLATIAAIESACGDRPIVEVLNAVIVGRRARDLIPLLSAALAAGGEELPQAEALAAQVSVGEAEAFVLALIFALGFTVGRGESAGGREAPPLADASSGTAGGNSRSAG